MNSPRCFSRPLQDLYIVMLQRYTSLYLVLYSRSVNKVSALSRFVLSLSACCCGDKPCMSCRWDCFTRCPASDTLNSSSHQNWRFRRFSKCLKLPERLHIYIVLLEIIQGSTQMKETISYTSEHGSSLIDRQYWVVKFMIISHLDQSVDYIGRYAPGGEHSGIWTHGRLLSRITLFSSGDKSKVHKDKPNCSLYRPWLRPICIVHSLYETMHAWFNHPLFRTYC